jgi:hypothetical protein
MATPGTMIYTGDSSMLASNNVMLNYFNPTVAHVGNKNNSYTKMSPLLLV